MLAQFSEIGKVRNSSSAIFPILRNSRRAQKSFSPWPRKFTRGGPGRPAEFSWTQQRFRWMLSRSRFHTCTRLVFTAISISQERRSKWRPEVILGSAVSKLPLMAGLRSLAFSPPARLLEEFTGAIALVVRRCRLRWSMGGVLAGRRQHLPRPNG